jgi:beta-lactamase class D
MKVHSLRKTILLSLLLFSQMLPKISVVHATPAIDLCHEGSNCTFVLLSELNNSEQKSHLKIVNDKRAKKQLPPFSTFKITNSLIGLELGLIKDPQQTLTFNKSTYPPQAWWPAVWKLPHYDLNSAFKYSMVAIYRQLASDIGAVEMQNYVEHFTYGNQDISSKLDSFWLNGSLKISALEQVKFLQSVYHNQFGLKSTSIKSLKSIMLVEENHDLKIYAKTGAGKVADGTMLGWYIGFVENKQGTHFFAFNFNRDTYAQMKIDRVKVAMNHLKELGIVK